MSRELPAMVKVKVEVLTGHSQYLTKIEVDRKQVTAATLSDEPELVRRWLTELTTSALVGASMALDDYVKAQEAESEDKP